MNYVDSLVVTGKYQFLPARPFAPGKLPVGEVSGLGPGVTEFKIGDRVLTLAEEGGYAEQVSIDASQCFKLPPSMSFVDAAAIALVYDTAWFALHERARLQAGESVLILGGTGAVGLAAIQIAKAMRAKVMAGVSIPLKLRSPSAPAAMTSSIYQRKTYVTRYASRCLKKMPATA